MAATNNPPELGPQHLYNPEKSPELQMSHNCRTICQSMRQITHYTAVDNLKHSHIPLLSLRENIPILFMFSKKKPKFSQFSVSCGPTQFIQGIPGYLELYCDTLPPKKKEESLNNDTLLIQHVSRLAGNVAWFSLWKLSRILFLCAPTSSRAFGNRELQGFLLISFYWFKSAQLLLRGVKYTLFLYLAWRSSSSYIAGQVDRSLYHGLSLISTATLNLNFAFVIRDSVLTSIYLELYIVS